jgi:transcription elongation factor GreA
MSKQYVMTGEGLRKLETELETLKTETRREIADKIKVALSFGDLSENSEYDEAKNEQAKVEARIAELEVMLKNAKVIDEDESNSGRINVGSKVKVLDIEYNEEIVYSIVGSAEADPAEGMISDESPVGRALIGAAVGDKVVAETPAGELSFKVLEILKK